MLQFLDHFHALPNLLLHSAILYLQVSIHSRSASKVFNHIHTMQGIATVAAVDCDDQSNQPLCGEYKVQGFPTLKVCPCLWRASGKLRLNHVHNEHCIVAKTALAQQGCSVDSSPCHLVSYLCRFFQQATLNLAPRAGASCPVTTMVSLLLSL